MSKCTKCEKEVGADFRFCPYCGTKLVSSPKPSFNLAELITVCNYAKFEGIWEDLKWMDTDKAYETLKEMQTPISVYGFGVTFSYWAKHDSEPEPYLNGERHEVVSRAKLENMVRRNGTKYYYCKGSQEKYTILSVSPEKVILTKTKLKDVGSGLFFTEEECEKEIQEITRDLEL